MHQTWRESCVVTFLVRVVQVIVRLHTVQKWKLTRANKTFGGRKVRFEPDVSAGKNISLISGKQGIQRQSPNLNNGPIEKFAKGRVE